MEKVPFESNIVARMLKKIGLFCGIQQLATLFTETCFYFLTLAR
jgi:hypothetical protein